MMTACDTSAYINHRIFFGVFVTLHILGVLAVLQDPSTRALWVVVVVLFAFLVGTTAGVLAWLGGLHASRAILTGGTAFGGTVALCLMIKNNLGLDLRQRPISG